MLGVTFGDKHSFHELGLWLKQYPEITPPLPKTKYVEVMGMDGALDLSKVQTGHMQYHRRTITMEFSILRERETWPGKHSEILDMLHGEEMDLILDDDPQYCYTGRLSVSGFDPQKVTSGVTIVMDAEPYKTKMEPTIKGFTVSGSLMTTIDGDRKPVIPTITASSFMQMTFGGIAYSLAAGENILPDVVIRKGRNPIVFEGDGTVAFEYREGRF